MGVFGWALSNPAEVPGQFLPTFRTDSHFANWSLSVGRGSCREDPTASLAASATTLFRNFTVATAADKISESDIGTDTHGRRIMMPDSATGQRPTCGSKTTHSAANSAGVGTVTQRRRVGWDSVGDIGSGHEKTRLTQKADPPVGFTTNCCIVLAVFSPLDHDGGNGLNESKEAANPMRIDQLTVRNFRNFTEKTIEFHRQFTVLVGDNGSGKTAVLDALRIGAGAYLLGVPDMRAPSIKRGHVRRETRRTGEFATFEPVTPSMVRCVGSVHHTEYCWHRELNSLDGRTTRQGVQNLRRCVARQIQEIKPDATFPLILSYDTGRLWIEPRMKRQARSAIRSPLGKMSRFEAYLGSLDPATSSEFLRRWIKKMALIGTQEKRWPDSLQAVYAAISGCVEGVDWALYDFELDDVALEFKGGDRYPFGYLSDGQRSMTALAADIAMRCVQLNPHLRGNAPKETEGVVLIDELDLHLHPNWQRRIVGDLTSFFPKLQFVATTHSPFIVQSLDRQGLVNLGGEGILEEKREPRSVEDVAEDTMGVKEPQRSRLFLEKEAAALKYYELLDRLDDDDHPDVVNAKKELDKIEGRFIDDPAYTAFLKLHRAAGE